MDPKISFLFLVSLAVFLIVFGRFLLLGGVP